MSKLAFLSVAFALAAVSFYGCDGEKPTAPSEVTALDPITASFEVEKHFYEFIAGWGWVYDPVADQHLEFDLSYRVEQHPWGDVYHGRFELDGETDYWEPKFLKLYKMDPAAVDVTFAGPNGEEIRITGEAYDYDFGPDHTQCKTEGPNKWEELSFLAHYDSEIRPYEVTINGMNQGAGWARGYFLVNNAKGKGDCP